MKSVLLILAATALAGCAQSGGSSSSDDESKDLFSRWETEDGDLTLDLRNASFDENVLMHLTLQTGEVCECVFGIDGNQSSGEYELSACAYHSGGSGDPGTCDDFEVTGTYEKSDSKLETCPASGSCTEYE